MKNKMILSNMLWVLKDQMANQFSLSGSLTVKPKYDNKENIKTYLETDTHFGIPRNFEKIPKGVEDCRALPDRCEFEFTGKLRPVQEEMIKDWRKFYNHGIDDWIIKGDTGVGKTVIMLKIACELKVPFLVVVPLERLMTQWIDAIKKFTTIEDVGIIRQNECNYQGMASVGMIHSLCKDKYPEEMKKHFGLIIYDEIHTTGAVEFSKVVPMFPAKHRCGASATLERQDGTENVYYFHLGRNIISTEIKTQPNPKIFFYEYTTPSGKLPVWIDRYDAIKCRAFLLSLIARNTRRNELIADFASTLMDKGLQILIIGDRIEQLREIQGFLPGRNTGLYIGSTSDKRKREIEKECECILATMKMLEVGIDIDTLRGLIFATPKSNVAQVVGRIRRINLEMPEPVVIDIVDTAHKEAKRWHESRKKWYREQKFQMKYITG